MLTEVRKRFNELSEIPVWCAPVAGAQRETTGTAVADAVSGGVESGGNRRSVSAVAPCDGRHGSAVDLLAPV